MLTLKKLHYFALLDEESNQQCFELMTIPEGKKILSERRVGF